MLSQEKNLEEGSEHFINVIITSNDSQMTCEEAIVCCLSSLASSLATVEQESTTCALSFAM